MRVISMAPASPVPSPGVPMYQPKYGILESIDGYMWILALLGIYDGRQGDKIRSALDLLTYYTRY